MLLNALKKDVVILKKQKKISQEYIQQGCGQFLNVENPRWNGGYLSVINLYDDMIKFANQTIKLLNLLYKEPENPFEFVVETFKKITNRKIKEQFPDYDGYYKVYHITLNRTGLWENKNNIYKELNKKIQTKLLKNKGLSEITQLKKMVDATINLSRPFKIQENVKLMKKLEGENQNE